MRFLLLHFSLLAFLTGIHVQANHTKGLNTVLLHAHQPANAAFQHNDKKTLPCDRSLSQAVALPANTSYYLVTEEFSGGDQWYEYNNVLGSTSAGTINGAVYSSSGSGIYNLVGSAGQGYGPTSLRYKSGSWTLANETCYVYDGMLPIQERDGNNVPRVTYTRGRNLSGSLDGAGGIGGLLARTDHSSLAPDHSFYHADGIGNITMLINQQQVPVAKYHYDPFGDTITRAGPLAEANTMRFSSKEVHRTSGLYYYGFRFYEPNLQRWLNQDPFGEAGGINLFRFVWNDPLSWIDPWGMDPVLQWHHDLPQEVFTPEFLKKCKLSLDPDSKKFGRMLPIESHQDLHPDWNDDLEGLGGRARV